MTDLTLPAPGRRALNLRAGSGLALLLAWLLAAAGQVGKLDGVGRQFNDSDDAMRLVQVRDFMAGQGWFDLVQHRLDPAFPVPMHWSRLVDAPIAGLMLLFRLVADNAGAERLAMIVWPQLVLLAAILGVAALSRRMGGDLAGAAAALLLALGLTMMWQFAPGRIDHHNVQATLLIGVLAALFAPGRRGGAVAGVLSGLALAVGLETLLFLGIAAGAVAIRYVLDPATRAYAGAYGAALALSTLALGAVAMPPGFWTQPACDAIAINVIALTTIGGLALVLAARSDRGTRERWTWMAAAAAAAGAGFLWADPACLRGPLGSLDPRLFPIWLDYNQELQTWTSVVRDEPLAGSILMAGPLMGMAAAAHLVWLKRGRADVALLAVIACFLGAFALGLVQVRCFFYANMLAVPLVGAGLGCLANAAERRGGSAVAVVTAGVILANSSSWALAAATIFPETETVKKADARDAACLNLSSYAELAKLPPGLVVAPVDVGPFVLAATPHTVLAAPYHRQWRGILDGDRILSEPPETAVPDLRARGAAYMALCSRSGDVGRYAKLKPNGLLARLDRGEPVAGVEPLSTEGLVRLYRVNRPD